MTLDRRGALVFKFLKALSKNNDREWFKQNRSAYDEARAAFEEMVAELIVRLSSFDSSVAHLSVKDCTYRIYRDIRFSSDKSPFKLHFGAYVNAHGKSNSQHGGYYLHLEPGNSLVAGGAYCLEPKVLRAVRESIVDGIDEFRDIVEEPRFHELYPVIGESRLKTAPKGFPKDFPFMDYLRPKDYSVFSNIPDSLFDTTDWLDSIEEKFITLKPFLDFINYTVDDYE